MLLSAVSFLVVAQSSSEVPEGLMNNPVCCVIDCNEVLHYHSTKWWLLLKNDILVLVLLCIWDFLRTSPRRRNMWELFKTYVQFLNLLCSAVWLYEWFHSAYILGSPISSLIGTIHTWLWSYPTTFPHLPHHITGMCHISGRDFSLFVNTNFCPVLPATTSETFPASDYF